MTTETRPPAAMLSKLGEIIAEECGDLPAERAGHAVEIIGLHRELIEIIENEEYEEAAPSS